MSDYISHAHSVMNDMTVSGNRGVTGVNSAQLRDMFQAKQQWRETLPTESIKVYLPQEPIPVSEKSLVDVVPAPLPLEP